MPILFGYTRSCALVLSVLGLGAPAPAVVSGVAVSDTDSRYDAVGLVLTVPAGVDPVCGGFISGTCTLIGPDLVILARHSVAGAGLPLPVAGARTNRVRFRRGVAGGVSNHYVNDCTAPFQEIVIAEFIGTPSLGVDIVLGRLLTRPVGIMPTPAMPTFVATSRAAITLAGWGYDGRCIQTGDAWTLRTKSAPLPNNPHASSCCFDYNDATFDGLGCVTAAAASAQAIGNLHDSGAPILVSVVVLGRTELRVAGIVSSTSTASPVSLWNSAGGLPRLPLLIPPPCPADFNGTGIVSVQDVFDYLAAFFGGGLADFDGSGTISVQDLFAFVQAFFVGCA